MAENAKFKEAVDRLKVGNRKYMDSGKMTGDVSPAIREDTVANGQHPYAVVIACSDSRVIPEAIFSAGIGELFVIRLAGNVIDKQQLGSVEYAVEHLHSDVVVVLGHTNCGAVGAAIEGGAGGYIASITDEIMKAIGQEKDPYKASCLNAQNSVDAIKKAFQEEAEPAVDPAIVVGAVYNIETGEVSWL